MPARFRKLRKTDFPVEIKADKRNPRRLRSPEQAPYRGQTGEAVTGSLQKDRSQEEQIMLMNI